ncbi:MAG: hypothetical protein J6B96_01705 [Agathobacter sp.]|nr:hypothetical protein [Agathobacter sp.]
MRKKFVELPLVEPLYQTYHDGIISACIKDNPSIRNWFLSYTMVLTCNRRFLSGYTSPEIRVENYSFYHPMLEEKWLYMEFINGYINPIIRNMIDHGYYVFFAGVDDYYVKGKSWYKERHFIHDGTICGYNQLDKTYCIYAYDSNWVYRKFWTPQKDFNKGRESALKKGVCGTLCAIKPKKDFVEFSVKTALNGLKDYLDSDFEKYPKDGDGDVRGIVVHEYIALYIDKLLDGSIPYERMDWRVFRLIWEHKKVMLERIEKIEQCLQMGKEISRKYQELVIEANSMRVLYATYHVKRRDSLLPSIKKKLLQLMETEKELLTLLVERVEKNILKFKI